MVAEFVTKPASAAGAVLQETARIGLPGVEGRIDHLALDSARKRLFVAALGNKTVEVIDLDERKLVQSLAGFKEPQGLLFVPGSNRLLVSDGDDDHVTIVDMTTLERTAAVPLPEDSDNLRWEAATGTAWVGAGSGSTSALAGIDPASGAIISTIALHGHPESFQIEQQGSRIFVNVPTARTVQVLDRREHKAVAEWAVAPEANFPMAIDEASRRVFVVTRRPAQLVVYDMDSGQVVTAIPVVGDADDVFYDAQTHRLYASGGEGFVEVVRQDSVTGYASMERVATRAGARTSLFVPDWRMLFVALPRQGADSAEIRVFSVAD